MKQSIQGNYLQSLENSYVQSEYNGLHQLLYTNEEWCKYSLIYEKCIKNITRKQVNTIIKNYLLKRNMVVCMVGETIQILSQYHLFVKEWFNRIYLWFNSDLL